MGTTRTVSLGLAGCGTVGSGVVRLLAERHDDIAARTGLDLRIGCVVVRDPGRSRDVDLPAGVVSADPQVLLRPDVDIVVELIGGCDAARNTVLSALRAGKPVVTANKALIAVHGAEVFAAARQAGVAVGFEASCCGGLPIVEVIRRGLVANRIDALYGIVNGTCNFILTEMLENGQAYADALAEAQLAGYAEPDPTLDVDGTDSAHKVTILASLAFGVPIDFDRVHVEGIEGLELTDLQAGRELGYACKLLAIARREAEGITLLVAPVFLEPTDPLAQVGGPLNAVSLYGHAVGHSFHYGQGAGAEPTASAVLADVVEIASGNMIPAAFPVARDDDDGPIYRALDDVQFGYYIRVSVLDDPGVFAEIARALADGGVAISALNRLEPDDDLCQDGVTAIVLTKTAREGDVRAGLKAIEGLAAVTRPPVAIRILDQHLDL